LFQACRADTVFFARDLEARGQGRARSDVLASSTVVPGHCRGRSGAEGDQMELDRPGCLPCTGPPSAGGRLTGCASCGYQFCCSAWAAGREIKAARSLTGD
jgi:hypothetical protein